MAVGVTTYSPTQFNAAPKTRPFRQGEAIVFGADQWRDLSYRERVKMALALRYLSGTTQSTEAISALKVAADFLEVAADVAGEGWDEQKPTPRR